MFTGIVTALGNIEQATPLAEQGGRRVRVRVTSTLVPSLSAAQWLQALRLGDSVCVSGACMTVVAHDASGFAFDISRESLNKTTGLDAVGGLVNLEQSLRLNDVLGGHLLSGHVDGLAEVVSVSLAGESHHLRVRVPARFARFVAVKGSITLNGVSLTVNQVEDESSGTCLADINLIPHTWQHTNLHRCEAGAWLNLEIDLIARYLERLSSARTG